ncbi:MAG: hypothetical protein KGD60_00005, partial [Candidatus Thorarchaeota archaeon]|nr:hypothetical protein [Candidatus Thorarchaeota archaeon]
MKWSKQLYSVLILSFIFVLSIHSTSSVFLENENLNDQVRTMDTIFIDEIFVQSSVNETTAYGPPMTIDVRWGWTGNLTFIYWDITKDEGIPGANVTCFLLGVSILDYFDLGNGTYLVEVNTTHLWTQPTRYYLFANFNKTGFEYQEIVTAITVFPVPTHLVVFSPEVNLY